MLYVTGDTHGGTDIAKLNSHSFVENRVLSKNDYVIVAGDFGLVQDFQNEDSYWLEWFQQKNFTTLFVDGNKENFGLLNSYPIDFWRGGKVHRINDSIIHLMRGQVFDFDGIKIFTFGGAKSKGIERKIENGSWWKEEMPSEEEYIEGLKVLERHNWNVDYIITHACPRVALEYLSSQYGIKGKANELHMYFDELNQKVKYKHWYFGHYHLDVSLSDKMTLLFNKVERVI
ncbi:MAG: metallophosphatase [Clostridia bacterium]|nr:metallophosphatase [Clostridia bacterium]